MLLYPRQFKKMPLFIIVAYWITAIVTGDSDYDSFNKVPNCDNHIPKSYKIFESESTLSVTTCSVLCFFDENCVAFAFNEINSNCYLSHILSSCEDLDEMDGVTTYVIVGSSKKSTWQHKSCKEILQAFPSAPSGVYEIDPSQSGSAFDVYCDMTTSGGGWTLVYSYGFTDYANFNTHSTNSNSLSLIPNWNWSSGVLDMPVSTTPPLSPSEHGAVAFNLWQDIGSEFLATSNINNWYLCQPGTGSLVTLTGGTITCSMVNEINSMCTGVPTHFNVYTHGAALLGSQGSGLVVYYEGYSANDWPTHDPCGTNQPNQLTGIPNPGGQIYLR